MTYLRNTWYVAAWANELAPGAHMRRVLLEKPVLLWRDQSGVAHALADRCPHRFAPLSMGTFEDGTVQCRYHGLKFDTGGRCVHNPAGPVPAAARVPTYPLVERHSLLWIWMGDAAAADASSIPNIDCQDPERMWVGSDYLRVKSNYALEIDNIMDLSHIEFLHASTLGAGGVAAGTYRATVEGQQVWSRRSTRGEIMTDGLCDAMGLPRGKPVDRWINVRWDAPANMVLFAGAVPTGEDRAKGTETPTVHCFTPETASTTHYFFSICFPKALGEFGQKLAAEQIQYLRAPFETEDLPMLEMQQQNIGDTDLMSLKPMLLAGDAGGVQARRALTRLIEAEQAAMTNG